IAAAQSLLAFRAGESGSFHDRHISLSLRAAVARSRTCQRPGWGFPGHGGARCARVASANGGESRAGSPGEPRSGRRNIVPSSGLCGAWVFDGPGGAALSDAPAVEGRRPFVTARLDFGAGGFTSWLSVSGGAHDRSRPGSNPPGLGRKVSRGARSVPSRAGG